MISFLSSRDHPFLFISLSLPSFYISISSAILLSIMDLLEFMTIFQKKASLAPLRLAYHMDRNRTPKNLWTYAYHVYLYCRKVLVVCSRVQWKELVQL